MPNEAIFDVAKSVGAFATDLIDLVEEACGDAETGLRADVVDALQRGLGRIEHDAAPGALDLAEQAVLDRIPLRGIGRVVRDAHTHAETPGQFDHVLLEAQRAGRVGAAAVTQHDQLGGSGVHRSEETLPGEGEGIADKGAGFA